MKRKRRVVVWGILFLCLWAVGCSQQQEVDKERGVEKQEDGGSQKERERGPEPAQGEESQSEAVGQEGRDAGGREATVREQQVETVADGGVVDQGLIPEQGGQDGGIFAPLPDESEGLVNISKDLGAVLENGALKDACSRYEANPADRRAMLLCGKAMFFYESFGTAGIPKVVVTALMKYFPQELGPSFAKYGMIADPNSAEKMPLGLAPAGKLNGTVDTVALTCASCHFGRLPDGRYAVGAPNHDYEYGKQILAFSAFPMTAMQLPGSPPAPAEVQKALAPLYNRMQNDSSLRLQLGLELISLIGAASSIPNFTQQDQIYYASWPSGTMDFIISPLPVDDKVHTVSKISALWSLPRPAEVRQRGMKHEMLGWTGGTISLERFVRSFVVFGKGDETTWTDAKLKPLVEYIYTLRPPKNPNLPAQSLVKKGAQLFSSKGCTGCHSGPRGGGLRIYTFAEIGTDDAIKKWMDPEGDKTPCCGITFQPDEPLTQGLKSPRLVGLWTQKRFLHNGALSSLEELFCLKARPPKQGDALDTKGHDFTCNNLSTDEKQALIAFLKAH